MHCSCNPLTRTRTNASVSWCAPVTLPPLVLVILVPNARYCEGDACNRDGMTCRFAPPTPAAFFTLPAEIIPCPPTASASPRRGAQRCARHRGGTRMLPHASRVSDFRIPFIPVCDQ